MSLVKVLVSCEFSDRFVHRIIHTSTIHSRIHVSHTLILFSIALRSTVLRLFITYSRQTKANLC